MSAQPVTGEIILAVNHQNVEDIVHQILENPLQNAPLYLGAVFDDNLRVMATQFNSIANEYHEKRADKTAPITTSEEQSYHIRLLETLEDSKDMLLSTAQIAQALLMYLNRSSRSEKGLNDMQSLQLVHLAQGTMTRCAEPLENIQKRQQEILARGQVRPQYKPVPAKGPKLG